MFLGNKSKGFVMAFENGFEISVQWGTMNYCSRRDDGHFDEHFNHNRWTSSTAEIMISGKDRNNVILGNGDQVAGWLSANKVAELITIVSGATGIDDLNNKLQKIQL